MTLSTEALPRRLVWRLASYYGAVFGAGGIALPFWPIWLQAHGLDRSHIGALLAAAMVARILAAPLIARVADRTGERKRLIVLLVGFSLACWCLFLVARGFWALLAVGVLAQGGTAAAMPLFEDMTLGAVRAHALQYGRVRFVGSVTFLAAALLGGLFLTGRPAGAVLALLIAGAAITLGVALGLPDLRPTRSLSVNLVAGLTGVLGRRRVQLLFLASGLIQASHMVYYGFGTIHWRAAGLSDGFIGFLWAEGVIAEVALFWYGAPLLRRVTPAGLILLGGGAAALRWLVTGLTTDPIALVALQALHGVSFGATHLGAMHCLRDNAPAGLSATAQGLHSALPMGLLGGLTMLAAGPLTGALGGGAFLAMAALAAAGMAAAGALRRSETADLKPETG
ncbi:MAG TPA: MFS transporter [Candidatus Sulfotelmatobacter sp.]|nr:MFS transporter [Candidatus Sulfotelmatobacter sp.]